MYDSQIAFTIDTICPWTYLARRRLALALDQVRATKPPVNFTIHYLPYQLYPDASKDGEPKYEWYKNTKYDGSDDKMQKYAAVMTVHGLGVGIDFKFGGTIANTLDAHRVIQYFQESKGEAVADRIVDGLYKRYFEQEAHPSSHETLIAACVDAGIDEKQAREVVEDEDEGLMETKLAIREQAGNGIDAVPHIVFEGKRRDLTLEGAREVAEYVKTLEQIIKESQ